MSEKFKIEDFDEHYELLKHDIPLFQEFLEHFNEETKTLQDFKKYVLLSIWDLWKQKKELNQKDEDLENRISEIEEELEL